ncbi:MAG TPA: tyrosine--tRNA ligase [Petrotogaceae bacterium]|nr:tyrosine--tRNA ligase [Petrotogaceae bacterium]HQP58226.1 tyrosine--tRNA ligase [Petrotogaceae bacterium]
MDPNEQLNILIDNTVDLFSKEELLEKLKKGRPLRIKLGVDPSRPDLHLGHYVVLRKLRQFQELGHQIVLIIGDFTARIGDPSGRSKTRPMLSMDEVRENARSYAEQVFKILNKEKTEIRYNGEWFDKMTFEQVIRISSKYTVARMMERDDFKKRYDSNQPISVAEFLYPIAQGYDSVMVKSDVEMGGTDQLFNLLVGRKMQEEYEQLPQVVLTMPLIEGTDGNLKMSKSYDNYIAFNDTSRDMFGKIMSIPDTLIVKYMRLLTDLGKNEIDLYEAQMKDGLVNPRDVKMKLGREVVAVFYGQEEGVKAQEEFIKIFRKKDLPDEMEVLKVTSSISVLDLVMLSGETPSKSEAKRLIAQGAVKLDEEKLDDFSRMLEVKGSEVLKIGKRKFFRIELAF